MAEDTAPAADVIETTTDATATQTTTIDPAEYARMQKALKDVNKESADRRKKLETYELAEKNKAEADMSEAQREKARADKAEAEATTARLELATERTKNATLAEAGKAQFGDGGKSKFIDPDAAYVFVKATNPELTNETAADALKALAKAKPWMLEQTGAAQQQQTAVRGQKVTAQTITQAQQDALNKKRQSYPPL